MLIIINAAHAEHFSQRKGRKLDLPAAAKGKVVYDLHGSQESKLSSRYACFFTLDKNAESGRPPYRGGEKGAGRHLTIYRSDKIVGKSQPYVRGGEVRSARKAPVSYQEPLTSSPPSYTDSAAFSPAPSSSSIEYMSPIRPRPIMRSDSVNLSSSRDVTPPRPARHQAPSPASSTGSRPSPSLNIPARNAAKRRGNFESVVESRQLLSAKKISGPKSHSTLSRKLEAAKAGSSPSRKRRSPLKSISSSKLNAAGSPRKRKSGTSMNTARVAKFRSVSR